MKRAEVSAAYIANETERYVVTVKIPASFPDAVDEARTQAVRGVHELLTDAIAQVPREEG